MSNIGDRLSWQWPDVFGLPNEEKFKARHEPRPISFPDAARTRHFVVFGGTGVGKSRLLESLMIGDAIKRVTGKSPRGCGLVDVHGDLNRNVQARLALLALDFPELENLVYLIDPTNPQWTVGYNPLELQPGEVPERKADMLATVVTTIYHDDPSTVTRMRWLLFHAFLTLALADLSLKDLPKLIRDREFREQLISDLDHHELTEYWRKEFPTASKKGGEEKEAMSWAESTLDRLGRVVADPDMADLLEGPSTIDFRRFLDDGAVVLVNAPKGKLGEGTSYLLCAFILAEFQRAALSRVDLPDQRRRPFSLLCDEFVNYTTDTIRQILAESRKVGLELGLAAQEVKGQLQTDALQSAVLNTVGNILAFRLGYEDASTLVKDVFTPQIDEQIKEIRPRYQKVGNVDVRFDDKIYRGLDEIWELEKRKITQLPDRMLWWKRRGYPGTHRLQTLTVADIEDLPNRNRLSEALKKQELAAFRLAGRLKESAVPRPPRRQRKEELTGSSDRQEHSSFWSD